MMTIVSCGLLISILIQTYLWLIIYSTENTNLTSSQTAHSFPKVSIVIAAKNEEANIRKCLVSIIDQNYPDYEIIVVNDHSTDQTESIIRELQRDNPAIQLCQQEPNKSGKKEALSLGITKASGEWIGLIDADCQAISQEWISMMMKQCDSSDIILGYGAYKKEKGILNQIIRYEAWLIARQYFGMAIHGKPYMGVGRNLFYKKSIWQGVEGYSAHLTTMSGDDDLFIMDVIHKLPSTSVKTMGMTKAKTISEPKRSIKDYLQQKRRHIQTSKDYPLVYQLGLSAIGISHIWFYLSIVILMFYGYRISGVALLVYRWLMIWYSSKRGEVLSIDKDIHKSILWIDMMLVLIYISLSFTLLFKPRKW